MNPHAEDVDVEVWTRNEDGWWFGRATVKAQSNEVRQAKDFFYGTPEEGVEWVWVIADKPLSGMSLFGRADTGSFAALQASGAASRGKYLLFPNLRANDTHWTGVVVLNNSGSERPLTIFGYDNDGGFLGLNQITIDGYTRLAKATHGENGWLNLTDEQAASLAYLVISSQDGDVTGLAVVSDKQSEGISGYTAPVPFD